MLPATISLIVTEYGYISFVGLPIEMYYKLYEIQIKIVYQYFPSKAVLNK